MVTLYSSRFMVRRVSDPWYVLLTLLLAWTVQAAFAQPHQDATSPAASFDRLEVTGTFDSLKRPTTRFWTNQDIHCGIRGTVSKGSVVEFVLTSGDGREVAKVSLEPAPRTVFLEKYIRIENGQRGFAAGNYTVQVRLNHRDIGRSIEVTMSVAPRVTPTIPRCEGMFDRTASDTKAAYQKPGQRYALLIGIGRYDDPGIEELTSAVGDVKALEAVLEDPGAGGFEPKNVHVLTDAQATLTDIGQQLVWLRGACTDNDTVLIYFYGHGYDTGGRSYLATTNTDPDNMNFSTLSVSKFNESVSLIKARKRIVILDACHGGSIFRVIGHGDKLTPQLARELSQTSEGEVRLLSCSSGETSKEDPQLGHGVFTHFIIKGMARRRRRTPTGMAS